MSYVYYEIFVGKYWAIRILWSTQSMKKSPFMSIWYFIAFDWNSFMVWNFYYEQIAYRCITHTKMKFSNLFPSVHRHPLKTDFWGKCEFSDILFSQDTDRLRSWNCKVESAFSWILFHEKVSVDTPETACAGVHLSDMYFSCIALFWACPCEGRPKWLEWTG